MTVSPSAAVEHGRFENPRSATALATSAVLHVVAGADYGGASVVVEELAASGAGAGMRVAVLTGDPRLADGVRRLGLEVVDDIPIQRPIRPIADLVAVARLTRHLRARHYDIVHTHTSKGGLVGRLAARLARVPVVIHTVHGFAFHDRSRPGARSVAARIERALSRITDKVVTVSEYHRGIGLEQHIAPADKLVAIPNGVADPSPEVVTTPSSEGPLRAEQRQFVVLCHGRLSPQKGVVYLLRAMQELPALHRANCRLVLAGEGELLDELQHEAARLGVADAVDFLGFQRDSAALVRDADLVVLPSLWEGLSISLLEALAMGKPVVTTAIPSNLEVAGDPPCAVLVPPADPTALAHAIARLMDSPTERCRLSAAARDRFLSTYRGESMCEAYLEIYRRALRP